MTTRAECLVERAFPDADRDPHYVEENLLRGARRCDELIPQHFRGAVADHKAILAWINTIVALAAANLRPVVRTGPSLLLLGGTGTGKTFQAYGALRALSESGVACRWTFTTAADTYARLRPRHRVDVEAEFERYARSPLLVIDDLGAAKASEWTEEINYRLVNYRYEHEKPTLVTSNVLPRELAAALGERVASRLNEMTTRVVLTGADRRRGSTST